MLPLLEWTELPVDNKDRWVVKEKDEIIFVELKRVQFISESQLVLLNRWYLSVRKGGILKLEFVSLGSYFSSTSNKEDSYRNISPQVVKVVKDTGLKGLKASTTEEEPRINKSKKIRYSEE